MTAADKLKALQMILESVADWRNGNPHDRGDQCIPDSALRVIKVLFPQGM